MHITPHTHTPLNADEKMCVYVSGNQETHFYPHAHARLLEFPHFKMRISYFFRDVLASVPAS